MGNLSVENQSDFPRAEEPQFNTKQDPQQQEISQGNEEGVSFIGKVLCKKVVCLLMWERKDGPMFSP